MSDHLRRQIRDAAAAVLAGLATTGTRVHPSRRHPFQKHELPALAIYTVAEESALETMGAVSHLSREVDLVVEGVIQVNSTTALDDELDQIAAEVETALGSAIKNKASALRQLIRGGYLSRTQAALQPAKEAELRTGSVVLTWRVNYRTRSDDPTTVN